MDIPKGQYLKNLLIAIDQLANAALGNYCDETLSSRCYRMDRDGKRSWPRKVVDTLFFWEKEHCYESYMSERERAQLPPEFRREK